MKKLAALSAALILTVIAEQFMGDGSLSKAFYRQADGTATVYLATLAFTAVFSVLVFLFMLFAVVCVTKLIRAIDRADK